MNQYVFGYGSLMNPRSLQKTLPGKTIERWANLRGYRRKFNVPIGGYLYLNLVADKNSVVCGVLVSVTPQELEKLKMREVGYDCVEVTKQMIEGAAEKVFVFIAPDKDYPELKILQSYINTCVQPLAESERPAWLRETILLNAIEDDSKNSRYPNIG